MTEKHFTCTVCPKGCDLKIVFDENNISDETCAVTGHTCKRGEVYAKNELISPKRTITSTVATKYGMLPVKSSAPIPKDKMFEAMEIINSVYLDRKVCVGDIIIKDFISAGINLVSCATVN